MSSFRSASRLRAAFFLPLFLLACRAEEVTETVATPLTPIIVAQDSGLSVRLQAVAPVNERVVWASGLGGTWTRSVDGGESWTAGVVDGAAELEFRDVHALDAEEEAEVFEETGGGRLGP